MVYRYLIRFVFKKHFNSVQVHHIPCGQSLAMKLFSKCPYTLDTCGTSLHTYSIWNTTAGIIQPCRTTALNPHTQRLGSTVFPAENPEPSREQCPHVEAPFEVSLPRSKPRQRIRRMIFAHGEWRRKRTQGVHIVDLMKNFCPPYKKKKKVHSDTYTVNISIHQSDYRFIRMTFANIYCHMGYHTQTCKPCSHTTHIRKLLQVAVAIINAASMQKTT